MLSRAGRPRSRANEDPSQTTNAIGKISGALNPGDTRDEGTSVAYLRTMAALQIARQLLDALTRDTRTMSRIVDGLEGLGNRAEWTAVDEKRYAELHMVLAEICGRYRPEASIMVVPPWPKGGGSEEVR